MITVEVNDNLLRFIVDPSRAELNTYNLASQGIMSHSIC